MKEQLRKILNIVFIALIIVWLGIINVRAESVFNASNQDSFDSITSKLLDENSVLSSGVQKVGGKPQSGTPFLIVKWKGTEPNWKKYNVKTVVKGPDGHNLLQFYNLIDTQQAVKGLSSLKSVEYVQQNYKVQAAEVSRMGSVPSSASATWSWGQSRLGTRAFAAYLKKLKKTSIIKIAVVDSGIYKHSAFAKKVITGKTYIKSESGTKDYNGHGTHVTGIIYDTCLGTNVRFMPIKVLNRNAIGNSFNMANGIRYAANHGAKVINMSANLFYANHDSYLHESILYAVNRKRVSVVISAGNEYGNVNNSCPADMKSVIVVGAVNENNKVVSFSNRGNKLDVVAPGVSVKSTYKGGGYCYMSGTSMAAPHISGIVAMLRLRYPSYGPASIEKKLKSICKDLYGKGRDNTSGYGIPNLKKLIPK